MNYVNLSSFVNKLVNRLEMKTQRTRLFSKPTDITIEPTLQCNSDCIMCNRNFHRRDTKKATGVLSWETLSAVKSFIKTSERILFGGFGEPLLHPEYLQMLKYIKKQSNPYVYFYTNGILLTEKIGMELVDAGVDMISISMGGATRKTYEKIRGVDAFETVVANIRAIHEYKKAQSIIKPRLSFNIVAMNSLLPEIEQIITLAYEIGVDHITLPNLTAQGESVKSESLWNDVEGAQKVFLKASKLAEKRGIEFFPPDLSVHRRDCKALFKQMIINWDGTVMSCSQERFITGDLNRNSIEKIWNSEGMIKLRRDYYDKGLSKICAKCSCWDNRPEIFLDPWENARQFAKKVY